MATVQLTPNAAKRILHLSQKDGQTGLFLRLAVDSGGCSGFKYNFKLESGSTADDIIIERDGAIIDDKGINIEELRQHMNRNGGLLAGYPGAKHVADGAAVEAVVPLRTYLESIVALTEDDTAPPVLSMYDENGPPSVSQQRVDDFGAAIWAVYDLRQLWKSLGPRVEAVRRAPEPGRNDPCPCGSGKKYKKCHGA